MVDIETLEKNAKEAVALVNDIQSLEALRIEYLGKKGSFTDILKSLAELSPEERPKLGQRINLAKQGLHLCIEERYQRLKEEVLQKKLQTEAEDISLPGRNAYTGTFHPVTQVKTRIIEYFSHLGFDVINGPEVETEFYNFEALNIPKHHPARAMHDTFYFGTDRLLRTHTSPVQVRVMQEKEPPFKLIAPGRVYRCDSDVTHTPMFHQVEGLLVDKTATMAQLKGVLQDFFSWFFERPLSLRFRPSYFPFTEPSGEIDIICTRCIDNAEPGCRSCKFTGWLEVGGCGMVHPEVLKAVNIDPEIYQGWAFGMGIDRLAMLYFGIDDLRSLFENDINFLTQF